MSEGLSDEEFEKLEEKLRREFSDYYEKAGGRDYRFFHLKFVYNAVQKLAESEEVSGLEFDRTVLEVAALFHDIGRSHDIKDGFMDPFKGHEGHAEKGAEIVSDYVSDYVDGLQIERIDNVIRNHHSEPESVEGRILQDADKLAKYGVADIWRMIHYASEENKTVEEAFDNFHSTLLPRLQEGLKEFNLDYTRKKAEERMRKQKNAVQDMELEMKAEDL